MPHSESLTGRAACVLIGTDTFPPDVNGAARFAREHAVRLARRGHDVHVIAPATRMRSSSGIEVYDGQRLTVHRLRSVRWPLHCRQMRQTAWRFPTTTRRGPAGRRRSTSATVVRA